VRDPTISTTSKQIQKRGDRRARQNKRSGSQQSRPSQIASNIELSHRYRFTSTSGAATSIDSLSLLCASGTVATGVNMLYSFYKSVRIKQVAIYAPPAAQGGFATCSVEWVSNTGNNREISDTSNSVSVPSTITSSPPRNSLASFWTSFDSTQILCILTAPIGSIIDVMLDLILYDDEDSANGATYTSTALATVGNVYYLALDNSNATAHYVPVSLTTIV
jgi:hypothetical protein